MTEEIEEELRAKAIASMSTNPNPNSNLKRKSILTREEGELSSSDGEDVAQRIKQTQNQSLKMRKFPPTNGSTGSVDIQLQTGVRGSTSKRDINPMPSKFSNRHTPGWYGPSKANDNLVISFSDGETGSDSEECKSERTLDRKHKTFRVDRNKRPASSSRVPSDILNQEPYNNKKNMPKKVSLSRTFISSITKIHGANRASGASSAEKSIQRHDHLNIQGTISTDSELESLRQQIAKRENELKLQPKIVPRSRERSLDSYGNYRMRRPSSVETIQLAPNEQEKKRLRVEESSDSKLNLGGQLQMLIPATKSISSEFKKQALEGGGCPKDKNMLSCSQYTKEIPVGGTEYPSSNLAHMASTAEDGTTYQHGRPSSMELRTEGSKHPNVLLVPYESNIFPKKAGQQQNLTRGSQQNDIISGDRVLPHASDNIFDSRLVHISGNKLNTSDAPLHISNLLSYPGQLNPPTEQSNVDFQYLTNVEELQDRELEEALELRRRCEFEERRALKAYRKAQRALIEANNMCNNLYRKRELISAQYQAFITENSNSMWPSRRHNHSETGLDSLENVPNINGDPSSSLSLQMQTKYDISDQVGYECNIRCTNISPVKRSYQHRSNPCSEPDASTSEPLHHNENSAVNGVCTPSNHLNMSADADEDEEFFPFDQKAVQSMLVCENKEENLEEGAVDMDEESERKSLLESALDSSLLEASLRSELIARLKMKASSSGSELKREHTADKGDDSDAENMKILANTEKSSAIPNQLLLEAVQRKWPYLEGSENPGRNICELSVQINDQCNGDRFSDNGSQRSTDPEEITSSQKEYCRPSCASNVSVLPLLKIVSRHVKVILPDSFKGLHVSKNLQGSIPGKVVVDVSCHDSPPHVSRVRATQNGTSGAKIGKLDSYTCGFLIDPFWPLCMFELRGKCNNEECSWQHAKDYKRNLNQPNGPASSDDQVRPSLNLRRFSDPHRLPYCFHNYIMSVPTYYIGLNLIKADIHTSGCLLARSNWQYWQRGFCSSFIVPFSVQRNLPSDGPSLQAGDGRDHDSWNRLFFQDGTMKRPVQGSDSEQSLELALDLFNGKVNRLDIGKVNRQDRKKKALSVLSQALNVDPGSVVLWFVYLHVYYRKEYAVGKDDMFLYAIQHNEGSYELWLTYINSRVQLSDWLHAYDIALLALFRRAHASDKEHKYVSACILDLFLQMMDALCMSGNVEKAVSRVYGLFQSATASDISDHTLLSDILSCLTLSDKSIMWICCAYLGVYRKLPEAVVQQFELEKELPFGIEWPPVQLTADEKHQAVKLMEMAVQTVVFVTNGNSYALRSAHLLAVSHVRCLEALEGLECAEKFLVKYMKLYPACIELVLIFSRLQKNCAGNARFEGFEEALSNWPKEIPGIQCIWNQYAEYALDNRGVEFTEKLMNRWFESVWKVQDPQNRIFDGGDNSSGSSELPSDAYFHSKRKDELFGLLNLSLHTLLQKNLDEARLTIDNALKVATAEDFKHCVREHATFVLFDGTDPIKESDPGKILSLLFSYLVDIRTSPISEPLSRKFYRSIKKPRIRQLIDGMLGPVSLDCTLMNSILEVWYGPSLLPEKFGKIEDLVDFVEALVEFLPANYQLALSVCRLMVKNFNLVDVASSSVMFWASSLLVNSILQAFPVAPEQAWVEVAEVICKLEIQSISERFYQQAVSVYPFSVRLWQSYFTLLSKMTGNASAIVEAAGERGIILN